MKNRTFISVVILIMAVLIVVGSCATGKITSVAKEDEELYGTWINTDYDETNKYAKIEMKSDGTWYEYKMSDDDIPIFKCEYTITDKWTDSNRNTYYKIIVTHIDTDYVPFYIISKINKTGNVYEDLVSNLNMPTEFDPDNLMYHYRIYYRQ